MNSVCRTCAHELPRDAFRTNSPYDCVWCQWASPEKRARARHADKVAADRTLRRKKAQEDQKPFVPRLRISEDEFVKWYIGQPDECYYCGLTVSDLRTLRLRRGGFGYFVSWDIDRKDPSRGYEAGNLALTCFACNMAKGNHFTEAEAKVLGRAIRKVFQARLHALRDAA